MMTSAPDLTFADRWTGLLAAAAVVFLLAGFALKMREWGICPLREAARVLRRPWLEAALLVFFAGGLVQYGSTKGTGGTDRGARTGPLRSPAPTVAPVAADLAGASLPEGFPSITNLCFWGVARGEGTVSLGIAWPASMSFTNGRIDVFGGRRPAGGGWRRLAQLDVGGIGSNAVVELACADFPTDGMRASAFYRLASQDDSDGDGLTDREEEWVLGTDPASPDTDGDGMPDGWEVAHGLDPRSASGDDGASGDVDHDGLCNYDESLLGCDPRSADSDGDGVSDYQEICSGSDPADGADRGVPSARFPYRALRFDVYGDYAAWCMTIAGEGPADDWSDTVSMASPGVGNEKLKILKKGASYRLAMKWLNSDGHEDPHWYCWQAKVNGMPTAASYRSYTSTRLPGNEVVHGLGWMAENADGLLTDHVHTHDGAGGNVAEGLEALLHVYTCEIAICNPDGESWTEIEKSRVLLDDEELKIKIRISPAISTLDSGRS